MQAILTALHFTPQSVAFLTESARVVRRVWQVSSVRGFNFQDMYGIGHNLPENINQKQMRRKKPNGS
jgi:hypothetical protein